MLTSMKASAIGALDQIPALGMRGVACALSARQRGNLSFAFGNDATTVVDARARLCEELGFELDDLVCAEQVHRASVAQVRSQDRGRGARERASAIAGVDALITDAPGVLLMLTFADCVPVLLFDADRPAVGLAHAGWRGTIVGIASETVQAMTSAFGSVPTRLRVAIGPAIGGCCYEVSAEIADAVARSCGNRGSTVVTARPDARPHVDLAAACRAQLLEAGVPASSIVNSAECTSCSVNRYFSHRAERGNAGRHAAVIGIAR